MQGSGEIGGNESSEYCIYRQLLKSKMVYMISETTKMSTRSDEEMLVNDRDQSVLVEIISEFLDLLSSV